MEQRALNTISCEEKKSTEIMCMNISSLNSHLHDLKAHNLSGVDVIWINPIANKSDYHLEQYNLHLNSCGQGKGVAVYFKDAFKHEVDICEDNYQITKMSSLELDIICVYRSCHTSTYENHNFKNEIIDIIALQKKTIICGDFNIDLMKENQNLISQSLFSLNFKQLIQNSTHLKGGILDHVYTSKEISPGKVKIEQLNLYFGDHDKLKVLIDE